MSFVSRAFYRRTLFVMFLVLSISNLYGQTPIDTTKVRQPYLEPRGPLDDILSVPEFLLDIPIGVLKGITSFVVDDLRVGPMASQVKGTVGDIKKSTGLYPAFGTGSRSGVKYGLGFTSQPVWTEEERLKLKAMFSAHDYQSYKAKYRTSNFISPDFQLSLLVTYDKKPWELFYGLTNTSQDSNKVNYNPEQTSFQAVGLWKAAPHWEFEVSGSYNAYNIFDGEDRKLEGNISDIISIFGFSPDVMRSSRLWSVGGALDHDWRNAKGRPTSGGHEIVRITYNMSTRDFDELEFWRLSIDLQQYLELFKKRTLAFRVWLESVDVSDNSPVLPFYLMTGLGGPDNLRGYRQNRFLDNDAVLASVEYRYPLLETIDAFLLLEEGRVFSNLSNDFKWHDWKYTYGGGLRIFNRQNVIINTFVAKSKEDTRFNLEFGSAF